MAALTTLTIDTTEKFNRLAHAPIVEAALEVRTRAEAPWEEGEIVKRLQSALRDYPLKQSGRRSRQQVKFVGPGHPPELTDQDLGWVGVRCESQDKENRHIAMFERGRFLFSRLPPYDSWDQFYGEAMRLWQIHVGLAKPVEVQRLGLRFINRIPIGREGVELGDFFHASPQTPRDLDLPILSFFYQNTFAVPGYPYSVNLIMTVQPATSQSEETGLILDIDVFTVQPFQLQDEALRHKLTEMRWLKNKVFFGSITNKLYEKLR